MTEYTFMHYLCSAKHNSFIYVQVSLFGLFCEYIDLIYINDLSTV